MKVTDYEFLIQSLLHLVIQSMQLGKTWIKFQFFLSPFFSLCLSTLHSVSFPFLSHLPFSFSFSLSSLLFISISLPPPSFHYISLFLNFTYFWSSFMHIKCYRIRSGKKYQLAFSSFQINELLKCPFHRGDSSASRDMQIELTLRFYLTIVRMVTSRSS